MADQATDWIEWAGGECPVAGDTFVHYRMRDGHEDLGPIGTRRGHFAMNLRWVHSDSPADIIAYRVVPA